MNFPLQNSKRFLLVLYTYIFLISFSMGTSRACLHERWKFPYNKTDYFMHIYIRKFWAKNQTKTVKPIYYYLLLPFRLDEHEENHLVVKFCQDETDSFIFQEKVQRCLQNFRSCLFLYSSGKIWNFIFLDYIGNFYDEVNILSTNITKHLLSALYCLQGSGNYKVNRRQFKSLKGLAKGLLDKWRDKTLLGWVGNLSAHMRHRPNYFQVSANVCHESRQCFMLCFRLDGVFIHLDF